MLNSKRIKRSLNDMPLSLPGKFLEFIPFHNITFKPVPPCISDATSVAQSNGAEKA
jgi:hypothetical protein